MNADFIRRLVAKLNDEHRRVVAKALYRVGGRLSRVKTYQRFYTLDSMNPDALEGEPICEFSPGGRHWTPCRLSMWLLGESMQIDWDHWPHWTCDYSGRSDAVLCQVCGGMVCPEEAVTA
jgi:hypothetical protein